MAVSPCSLFFSIPLGKVALPSRRCGISKGCGWYRLCPPRLQYDRFEFEVRTYYWYAPFLADTERLMQAVAFDVTGSDNQLRDRLRFDDGTQFSHSAANGHTDLHLITGQVSVLSLSHMDRRQDERQTIFERTDYSDFA